MLETIAECHDEGDHALLVAVKDFGSHTASGAQYWLQKAEDILGSQAKKNLSSAEGFANKAIQFSTQALDDVLLKLKASNSSVVVNEFLVQLQCAVRDLLTQKSDPTVADELDESGQRESSKGLIDSDQRDSSGSLQTRQGNLASEGRNAPANCPNEEIEIVYMDQEFLVIPQVDLEGESVDPDFAATGESRGPTHGNGVGCESVELARVEDESRRASPSLDNEVEARDDIVPEEREVAGAVECGSTKQTPKNSELAERDLVAENKKHSFLHGLLPDRRRSTGSRSFDSDPSLVRWPSKKTSSGWSRCIEIDTEVSIQTAVAD